VKLVPKGRVTSYGAIAKYLGTGMSSRMVGWAMKNAPKEVPAHRVVNRIGILTGKLAFPDSLYMQRALEKEGVMVKKDQVQDFKKVFWDPMIELDLQH
jgi:methylated-DNA-protein-cysteine methyltransferase related protein